MSILSGWEAIVDEALSLTGSRIGRPPHFRHWRALVRLCNDHSGIADGPSFAAALIRCIDRNWQVRKRTLPPSLQNWRFAAQTKISERNCSPEVSFERAVVCADPVWWANQVPTSSGLTDPTSDRRRSIDLVHRRSDRRSYEFIELKIACDTPLYAAVELFSYGVLYVFSRQLPYYVDCPLIQAECVDLRVLAPSTYYRRRNNSEDFDLSWLERLLDDGIAALTRSTCRGPLAMSFAFSVFPEEFAWDARHGSATAAYALSMVSDRRPLYE
ncbi:MAG: hypothetical protein IPK66_04475 [Rhodospirillales bacterium]|nr:hypothetical protein [Rhodospirillales bacterium]